MCGRTALIGRQKVVALCLGFVLVFWKWVEVRFVHCSLVTADLEAPAQGI